MGQTVIQMKHIADMTKDELESQHRYCAVTIVHFCLYSFAQGFVYLGDFLPMNRELDGMDQSLTRTQSKMRTSLEKINKLLKMADGKVYTIRRCIFL